MRRACLLLGAAACATACGGSSMRMARFSTDWTDDGGISIGHVYERLSQSPVPPSANVVVGIAGHTDKLLGLPLDGGAKWTFAHPIDSRPVVAGGVVVVSGGGELLALDAHSGTVLWRRPTGGLPVLGAGDDGSVTAVTLQRAGGTGSTLLAVARDGQVVQQMETDKPLGTPAVVAKLAFVPWASQYVSVIDLTTGDEIGRATLREQVSRAFTLGGSLWFGQNAFVRFDEHVRDASRGKASRAGLPARELPGTPKLGPGSGEVVPAIAGAADRVHLYAHPEGSADGAALSDGRWYATYFRLALGFGAKEGKLAWVHVHPADLLGGAAAGGGVVFCDEQGKVTTLDAKTGGVASEADLGEPLKACVVNVDGARPSGAPADVKSLAGQLADAVTADDLQLVIAQKLLLRELAGIEDESATKTLIDVASDPRTSPDMLPEARKALANRTNGASFMITALGRHYDFLKDVLRAPPVGPMAHALGAMKDRSSANALASHLLDPADTVDDLKEAAAALAVVGGQEQVPALRQFFGMYRARAEDDDVAGAVVSVGQALLATDAAPVVVAASKDEATVPFARERLQALVAAAPPPPPDPKKKGK